MEAHIVPTLEMEFEKPKKRKIEEIPNDIKYEHTFQQIINDLYPLVESGFAFDLKEIEKVITKNLLENFNRTETADLLGITSRALRYKLNGC